MQQLECLYAQKYLSLPPVGILSYVDTKPLRNLQKTAKNRNGVTLGVTPLECPSGVKV